MEKMMKTRTLYLIETAVVYISGCLLSGVLGYSYCEHKNEDHRVDIIKQNTEIIKSISGVAITQSAISDLLVRLSHYTDKHEGGNHMCPECSGREFEVDDIEEEEDEVEETHKQVMADLREIESSIDSLTFGHLHQITKLETMLKREKEKVMIPASEFFGGVEHE
jgi:hypothetical protein